MNKRYRLIKEYPGCPELGTISTHMGHREDDGNYTYLNYPSKYPEFWQEIVEKDYEILSYKYHDLIRTSDFWKGLKVNKEAIIYSIKRLSDGEVFTVGDNLETGIIQSIHILNTHNTITFGVTKDDEDTWIVDAIKAKQKLFTTEDGVDIFEGNKYYQINTMFVPVEFTARGGKPAICFSTKEKAEEYIIYNKPCLSLNDIKEIRELLASSYRFMAQSIFDMLKKKVKQKVGL